MTTTTIAQAPTETDTAALCKYIRKACRDRTTRDVLLALSAAGVRMKRTRSGITVYGPTGTAGTHLTASDHRASKNFAADLRRAGLTPAR